MTTTEILETPAEALTARDKCELVLKLASQLEPLPATLTRLSALDSNCDLADVAATIRMDPVLTMQLIKTANSAFSMSGATVETVDEAVMRLGTGLIVSMAFALSVGKTMSGEIPAYGLAAGRLWRHSAAAAIAAEVLTRIAPQAVPRATVTAALLHDTGKLLLARSSADEELLYVGRARVEAGLSLEEAEMEIMEMSHPEIGFLITTHWGLPERVCRAIQYHADPDRWNDTMCDAVHLADLAARVVDPADPEDPILEPSPAVIQRLGLQSFDFKKFCTHSADRFRNLRALYGA